VLGSEVSYLKIIGTTQWFFPLAWETVGAVSLQSGIAEAFGSTGEIPISRRFFLGGSTTMRSYDFERIGPAAPNGTPTGGDLFVLANLEWRVPVSRGLGIVLFSDVGNVFGAIDDFRPGQIKGSVGLGVRYHTPMGRFASMTGASSIHRGMKPLGTSTSPLAGLSELRESHGIPAQVLASE
jgi:outer membrane protein insertion porin family